MQWSFLVNICDLIATFAFAIVGARVAAAKRMDWGFIPGWSNCLLSAE